MAEEVKTPVSKGLPKWVIVVIAIFLILFAGLGVAGYVATKVAGKIVKSAIERETGSKVDYNNNGSVTVKNKDGQLEVGTTAKWPSDAPADVPQFPTGTITVAAKTNNDTTKSWSVIIKDVEKVSADAYVQQLKNLGWKVETEVNTVVVMTQLSKGNLQLTIAYDPSSKGVNLTVEDKTK